LTGLTIIFFVVLKRDESLIPSKQQKIEQRWKFYQTALITA